MTELGQLRSHYEEIQARGVDVLAVSVDPPATSEALRRRLELPMRFLCDERGTLMDVLHIRHRNGSPVGGGDIFLPTTFLLDERGTIRWIYRPDTYRVRAPAAEVLRAIDALG